MYADEQPIVFGDRAKLILGHRIYDCVFLQYVHQHPTINCDCEGGLDYNYRCSHQVGDIYIMNLHFFLSSKIGHVLMVLRSAVA